jgi:hypothetical protein
VECLTDYQLHLRFEDGVEGVIDVAKLVTFTGVFAPLKDKRMFTCTGHTIRLPAG